MKKVLCLGAAVILVFTVLTACTSRQVGNMSDIEASAGTSDETSFVSDDTSSDNTNSGDVQSQNQSSIPSEAAEESSGDILAELCANNGITGTPSSILVYNNDNTTYTITDEDSKFSQIVDEVNDRMLKSNGRYKYAFNSDLEESASKPDDYDNCYDIKHAGNTLVELIFDEKQTLQLKNGQQEKYTKLLLPLSGDLNNAIILYWDDKYQSLPYSYAPVDDNLLELVKK